MKIENAKESENVSLDCAAQSSFTLPFRSHPSKMQKRRNEEAIGGACAVAGSASGVSLLSHRSLLSSRRERSLGFRENHATDMRSRVDQ